MRCWLLGAVLLAGLSNASASVTLHDDAGQALTLAVPARRAVALSPHLTELVFAAGAGDRLVGVMRYSDFPPEAAKLPVVGDAFAINLEAIAGLRPDLLLVWTSGVNPRQQQRLPSLGLPLYASEIDSVKGIARTLRQFGRLFGTERAAEAAARQTESRWSALREQYAGRTPVRVFYQLWHEPLMTINDQHGIAEAISACGGINVFGKQTALTPTVGWEAAIAADPQIVVTGTDASEPAQLDAWRRFNRVDAVRRGQLVALPGHRLARMTPAFVDGAQALCEAIDRARR